VRVDAVVKNYLIHTQDQSNKPDSDGRVLVDVCHPSKEKDIFLPPQLARTAKAHQVAGIRFLYDNVVGSQDQYETSTGSGCILAHSMGLGKTFQACAFSDAFLRSTTGKKILIIVPHTLIHHWCAQFNHWLPSKVAHPLSDNDPPIQTRHFQLHVLNDNSNSLKLRFKVSLCTIPSSHHFRL